MFKLLTKSKHSAGKATKEIVINKNCSGDEDCPMCHISPEIVKTLQQPTAAKQKDCCK